MGKYRRFFHSSALQRRGLSGKEGASKEAILFLLNFYQGHNHGKNKIDADFYKKEFSREKVHETLKK